MKIFWYGGSEFQIFFRYRMKKAQDHCMEGLPLEIGERTFFRSIDRITQKGVSDTAHVHTDLMGTSGFQSAFNIRIILKALQHQAFRFSDSLPFFFDPSDVFQSDLPPFLLLL